jgi:hypothetical protein
LLGISCLSLFFQSPLTPPTPMAHIILQHQQFRSSWSRTSTTSSMLPKLQPPAPTIPQTGASLHAPAIIYLTIASQTAPTMHLPPPPPVPSVHLPPITYFPHASKTAPTLHLPRPLRSPTLHLPPTNYLARPPSLNPPPTTYLFLPCTTSTACHPHVPSPYLARSLGIHLDELMYLLLTYPIPTVQAKSITIQNITKQQIPQETCS